MLLLLLFFYTSFACANNYLVDLIHTILTESFLNLMCRLISQQTTSWFVVLLCDPQRGILPENVAKINRSVLWVGSGTWLISKTILYDRLLIWNPLQPYMDFANKFTSSFRFKKFKMADPIWRLTFIKINHIYTFIIPIFFTQYWLNYYHTSHRRTFCLKTWPKLIEVFYEFYE